MCNLQRWGWLIDLHLVVNAVKNNSKKNVLVTGYPDFMNSIFFRTQTTALAQIADSNLRL